MRGSKPGERRGGRKKGSRNKIKSAKVEAMEAAAAAGETPLDYMLRIMRDPRTQHERRDRMAAAAAPYIHAKLASIMHSGDQNKPVNVLHRLERVIVSPANSDGGGIRTAPAAEPI